MALFDLIGTGSLRRTLVPASVAVGIGVVAWLGIGPLLSGGDATDPAPPTVVPPPALPAADGVPPVEEVRPFVLVASTDIASGVLILGTLVEWREWDEAGEVDLSRLVVEGVVALRSVTGAVATRAFAAGTPVTWDGLVTPGHPGFISAALAPGMLGVTIEVDRATTNARVIYPGDRVDVIMVSNPQGGLGTSSHTIVHDSRVLAVGSTVLSLGRYGRVSLTQAGQIEPVPQPDGTTYTLEVSAPDAERMAIASAAGQLTLAMRSITERYRATAFTAPTRFEDVMASPGEVEAPPSVRILRGAAPGTDVAAGW